MSCCNRKLTHTSQQVLAEGIGSFILCLTVILSSEVDASSSSNAPTFLAIGPCLAALVYGLGHLSAHFNPAVTLSAYLQGFLPLPVALAFVASQCAGGSLGGVIGNQLRASPIPSYNPGPSNLGKAFAAEAFFTGALVLVMQSTGLFKQQAGGDAATFHGLAVGLLVAAGSATVTKISGGCFNPAIGLGIDFATLAGDASTFNDIWLYWLAPLTGAVLATIYTRAMFKIEHDKWAVPGWFCRCRVLCCKDEGEEEAGTEDDGRMPLILPVSEAVGTFFITLTSALQPYSSIKAISIGAIYTSMIYALDGVCGADFNPAVTLGVALRRGRVLADRGRILTVVAAQCAGALAGCVCTFLLNGGAGGGGVNYPAPNGNTGAAGAVFFEAGWVAFLVYTVCAVMTETQEEEGGTATAAAAAAIVAQPRRGAAGRAARALHGGLAIGLVYLAGVLCASKAGTGSGGVFNPALGVATAFVSNNGLSNVWVYVAGPAAGAAMGAALFALLHLDRSIGIDEQAPKDAGTYAFVDSYQNSQDTQLAASGARYPYMI